MKLSRKLYLIYVLPALLIHELSHMFFLVLFIKKFSIKEWRVVPETQHYFVDLRMPPLSVFMCFFVSYAPLFSMLFFLFLGFHYEWAWLVFLYQVTAAEVSVPSAGDIRSFEETYFDED